MRIHLLACLVISIGVACGGDDTPAAPRNRSVSGTVTGEGAAALEGVAITVGDLNAVTGADGTYAVADVPVGDVTVMFESDDAVWEDVEVESVVGQGADVVVDIELAIAMRVLAADKTLADTYNNTFDWTTDSVSVVYVPRPTRGALEVGMFRHNPALYADPGGESQITPGTLPAIGAPATFDFQIPVGTHVGLQALEQSTIVDAIGGTPLTSTEQANGVMWEPAVEDFLLNWDLDATTPLFLAGLAVTSQEWGASPSLAPQAIEKLYVHEGDLWVEIVFQDFVDLDGSITDSDSDGLREVFGKIASTFVDGVVYGHLNDEYVTKEHGSKELRDILDIVVDGLYSRSNPLVVSEIGVPYEEATAVSGTFQWPFAVVGHGEPGTPSYVLNVFLVEPAP